MAPDVLAMGFAQLGGKLALEGHIVNGAQKCYYLDVSTFELSALPATNMACISLQFSVFFNFYRLLKAAS